ncbi:hypothetical protein CDD82_2929 [Ophiocordyceps australis]|uniref:mRNA decay factor PAT1 domain-containing protein n=1 Tax=Ophiocordyceps australis TaxID=1399860 RepID=A0A2C5ZF29_9HYPO|nr:hypothetical protein CDD82_2929 [Ophiocordyceps australis]
MSFFDFDTSGRHNTAAPGFSQAHDPFAGLSGRGDIGHDVLDFEDTYDGLGDQLDETDDAFNDDTFGTDAIASGPVGKDFDFFGQTAKVSDAIEEEHMRFHRQQPAPRSSAPLTYVAPSTASSTPGFSTQKLHQPARSGYEKYRSAEPIPELHVDQSIWGIAPPKSTTIAPQPPAQPAQQPAGKKMMSLEEVEAAMQAGVKKSAQVLPEPANYTSTHVTHPVGQPPSMLQHQSQHQQQQSQAEGQVQTSHGHPITILQRPQSMQSKQPAGANKHTNSPVQHPPQRQHQAPAQPMQILQNPKRLSGDASRTGIHGHHSSRSQGSVTGPSQPHLVQMSDQERTALLDQETKRAKRNHKIWILSKDNGLMTPQDKNFITRIQLQQLVSATGNPAEIGNDTAISEDFYYQVYSHIRAGQRQNPSQPLSNFAQTYLFQLGTRHGGMRRHGRPAENHMQRMEQQVQRAVEAAKNKPKNPQLVIAGSLGKIAFSNSKTPKPLLNIKRTESETARPSSSRKSPETAKGLDRKRILRNIERVYDTLMEIENHIRHMPAPLNGPPDSDLESKHREWALAIEAYNAKLWEELKVHEPIGQSETHPFIAFLSFAKGKKAIPRIFPHMNFEQRTTILTMIVFHLEQLDVVRGGAINSIEDTHLNARMRENIDLFISTVMPSLMQYFNDTGLDIVDGALALIASSLNVDLIARTRIGVSMLTLILSRAVLLKQTGAGDASQWDKWDQTFETFFNKLESSLPSIFPGSVNSGVDVYVWQLLAAMGVSASHDQQTRLVLAVKERVLDTVALAKTLPPAMASERLGSVNLFMRSIGLDVEMLQ